MPTNTPEKQPSLAALQADALTKHAELLLQIERCAGADVALKRAVADFRQQCPQFAAYMVQRERLVTLRNEYDAACRVHEHPKAREMALRGYAAEQGGAS